MHTTTPNAAAITDLRSAAFTTMPPESSIGSCAARMTVTWATSEHRSPSATGSAPAAARPRGRIGQPIGGSLPRAVPGSGHSTRAVLVSDPSVWLLVGTLGFLDEEQATNASDSSHLAITYLQPGEAPIPRPAALSDGPARRLRARCARLATMAAGLRRSAFVGRADELARLNDALQRRVDCPGLFLAGEAGIGKTRLIHG